MPDLLLELYSDEIPSRWQEWARETLCEMLASALARRNVPAERPVGYVTPNRLVVVITGLPDASSAETVERRGPRRDAPGAAIEGFARSAGVEVGSLELRMVKSAEYHFAVIEKPGQPVQEVLAEEIPELLREFPWPKSMRWGAGRMKWVRPLNSMLCILHDPDRCNVVDFEIEGMRSGRSTRGHRFMSPGPIEACSFDDYCSKLDAAGVMLDSARRRQAIEDQVNGLASLAGVDVVPDAELLQEIAGLVEWPMAVLGEILPRYRRLPPEILVASLKTHQKFVSLTDPQTGQVTHYAAVINKPEDRVSQVIAEGYRRVLDARLNDAEFAWEHDLRRFRSEDGLPLLTAALDRIQFHSELGTLGQRMERIAGIASAIAGEMGCDAGLVREAVQFAKLDLVSGTVGEFPELQGVIGRHLASEVGLDPAIGLACEEHYLPRGPDQPVPHEPVSVVVSLADKLELLAGFFAINRKPTGSRDPFALRRSALGVVRILLENRLRLQVRPILLRAVGILADQGFSGIAEDGRERVADEVLEFIHERLSIHLAGKGLRSDCIAACLAVGHADDLLLVEMKARLLQEILDRPGSELLVQGFRRASNILRDLPDAERAGQRGCIPALLATAEEKNLHAEQQRVREAVVRHLQDGRPHRAIDSLFELMDPIDGFFDHVRVIVDDAEVKRNRVILLAAVRDTILEFADLTHVRI